MQCVKLPNSSIIRLMMVIIVALIAIPLLSDDNQNNIQQVINTTVDTVKPALVRIMVVSVEDSGGREVKEESSGSGIIIDPAGYIVTNHHVAGHAKQIKCTMADKSEIDAELIGTDPATDIAVIKLKPSTSMQFPVAKFGDSSLMRVGDQVLAMGSPLSFSQSVTMGIISNTELVIPSMLGGLTLDGEDIGSLVRWIAHDSRIQPGNSGGPLINIKGEIIGINEIELGLGGAIPSNLVKEVSSQLIKFGKVTRSWLGLTIQPLLKSQNSLKGVLIGSTVQGSPADIAGIKSGDVLIKLAAQDISVRFEEELPLFNQFAASLEINKEIEAIVLRDGNEVSIKITPIERQNAFARPNEFREWGFCASDLTFFTAKEKKRTQTGILITSLRQGGPSENAKPSISEGDVIVKVAGKPINNLTDLRNITKEIIKDIEEPVPTVVEYEREANHYITVVNLGFQELLDSGLEVKKAWIPINTQVLTRDIAKILSIPDRTGVIITQVYKSPDKSEINLKTGDIITMMNNTPIESSEPEDIEVFPTMVRQLKVGSSANLSVLREGKTVNIPVLLQQSPLLAREMKKHRDEIFDFTVRDICFFDRVDEQWSADQTGILIESIDQGGWASVAGLLSGDLIISIDSQPTPDINAFQTIMKKINNEQPKNIVFRVKNGIHEHYVEIEPAWPIK